MTSKTLTLVALVTLGAAASADPIVTLSEPAVASPLDLFASCSPDLDGVHYDYLFTLELTDMDGSWTPGQGWGWITFDDTLNPSIVNFVGDPSSFASGPWTGFDETSGDDNGYALAATSAIWYPTALGDAVSWTGVADSAPLTDFTWSSLFPDGTASEIHDKTVLTTIWSSNPAPTPVPEPASLPGLALCAIPFLRRRRV